MAGEQLILPVKLVLQDSRQVKDALRDIQKVQNASTGATKKKLSEEEKLIEKIRRRILIEETAFRRDQQSQEASLEGLDQLQKETDQYIQRIGGVENASTQLLQKTKSLNQANIRVKSGFKSLGQSVGRTNVALTNVGRVVQDLPFGFIGVSNNIDPLLTSFRQLGEDAEEAAGKTLSGFQKFKFGAGKLLGSLAGPGGLIFALGSLLPTAILIAQNGILGFDRIFGKSKETLDEYNKALEEQINLANKFGKASPFDLVQKQQELKALEDELALRQRLGGVESSIGAVQELSARGVNTDVVNGRLQALFQERDEINKLLETSRFLKQETGELEEQQEKISATIESLTRNVSDSQVEFARYAATLESDVANAIDNYNLALKGSDSSLESQITHLKNLRNSFRILVEQGNEDVLPYLKLVDKQIKELEGTYFDYGGAVKNARREAAEEIDKAIKERAQERYSSVELVDVNTPKVNTDFDNPYKNYAETIAKQDKRLADLRQKIQGTLFENTMTIQEQYIQLAQDRSRTISNIRNGEFENELEREKALFEAKQNFMQRELALAQDIAAKRQNVEQSLAQSKVQINQAAFSALGSLSQAFAKDNKAVAIGILAIEKGLKIAQVVTQGLRAAGEATALGSLYAAQSITPLGPNPAAAAAAANAFSQAAAIKANTGITAALIAAQGLGEAVSISNRGSRSNGTSAGSAGAPEGTREGFFTDSFDRAESERARPEPRQKERENVIVLKGALNNKVLSVEVDRGRKQREAGSIVLRSD